MNPYMESMIVAKATDISKEQFEWLQKTLVIPNKEEPGEYVRLYSYNPDDHTLTLPRSMAHLFPDLEMRTQLGRRLDLPPSKFKARKGQEACIQDTVDYLKLQGGGLLEGRCGSGKTQMGAEIILRMNKSACILVHKHFLAEQWRKTFHGDPKIGFPGLCPSAKIGYISSDTCDSGDDFDIVIATVQSITNPKREYPREVYNSFGILVMDESLPGESLIDTEIGRLPIRTIVEQELPIRVWSLDKATGALELKPILAYHAHAPKSPMLELTHSRGTLRCTANHELIGEKDIPAASALEEDILYVESEVLIHDSKQSTESADSGDFARRWLHDPWTQRGPRTTEDKPLDYSGASSSGEIPDTGRSNGDTPKASKKWGMGQRLGDFYYALLARISAYIQTALPGGKEDYTHGGLGELIPTGDGMVGDGRWLPQWDFSHTAHRGTHAGRVRESCPDTNRTRLSSNDIQGCEELHSIGIHTGGLAQAGTLDTAAHASQYDLQDRRDFSAEILRLLGMRGADIKEPWRERSLEILPSFTVSESSEASRFWLLQEEGDSGVEGTSRDTTLRDLQGIDSCRDDSKGEDLFRKMQAREKQAEYISLARITEIREIDTPVVVYDLEVEGNHNFVADGVIVHNCHRYGAELWQKAIGEFPAHYRLGLTAEAYRADGMMPVIWNHVGKTAAILDDGEKPICNIHFVNLSIPIKRESYTQIWNGQVNRARLLSALGKSSARNEVIIRMLKKAVEAGRKIMVLSERLDQLDIIYQALKALKFTDTGFYIGGKKQEQLDEAANCQVVLATFQMAQEGLDIPELDTLFLATPMVRITQSVGRILRRHEGKKESMVVDFVDNEIGICIGMKGARLKLYKKLGYQIK